jgi:hypothetical protein
MIMRPSKTILPFLLSVSLAGPWAMAQDAKSTDASSAKGLASVLIRLREVKGRATCLENAQAPPAHPDEARQRDCDATRLAWEQAQANALRTRLLALGAANLEYYPAANILRADVPAKALGDVGSEPAVAAVIPMELGWKPTPAAAPEAVVPNSQNTAVPFKRGSFISETSSLPFGNPFAPALTSFQSQPALPFPAGSPGLQMPAQPYAARSWPPSPGMPFSPQMNGAIAPGQLGMSMGGGMAPGSGIRGMLVGLAGNLALGVLSTRGGMGGMMGGIAGNFALNVLTSRTGGCKVTVSPSAASFPAAGGSGSLEVNAPRVCAWEAVAGVDWIQIKSGAQGMGPGSVSYAVVPSTGNSPERSGEILVGSPIGIPIRGRFSQRVTQSAGSSEKN